MTSPMCVARAACRCAAAALVALAPAANGAPAAALSDCHVPGLRNGVLCGTLQRPLDPAHPERAEIGIRYVVVPAMARRKLSDPVFLLAGGPGQSAVAVAAQTMALFSRLNNRRDIVFVDQRGTGRSAPLECAEARREPLSDASDTDHQVALLARCRARLGPHLRARSRHAAYA